MFHSIKSNSVLYVTTVFFVARFALSAWVLAITHFSPVVVANLDLHDSPTVAAFNLQTNTRAVFSRVLDGERLSFREASAHLADLQTNSSWNLDGRAIAGEKLGAQLEASVYSIEDVFPYRGIEPSLNVFLAPWQRFDTNWFLKIARHGYSDDGSVAYLPLYPLLIRLVDTLLLGEDLLASILVSNLALLGSLFILHQIALEHVGAEGARRTVVLYVLFPTAFFLFAAYSESLFLLCTLASLRAGQRAQWWRAGIAGALAALTRLQGGLLILPLAYLWFKNTSGDTPSRVLRLVPLLLIPFSTLGYLAFTNLSLLNAYQSQLHARFVMPWDNVIAAVSLISSPRGSLVDVLNLVVTGLFGLMVIQVWRKLPRELGLYSIAMYLAPLFRMTTEQPLVSMLRYVLVIFPTFMLWGRWGANSWLQRVIVYACLPLELYLTAQFVMWGWVG